MSPNGKDPTLCDHNFRKPIIIDGVQYCGWGCGAKAVAHVCCEDECEHLDLDHGICLDCGVDRTDEVLSQAFERAKNIRKYGE